MQISIETNDDLVPCRIYGPLGLKELIKSYIWQLLYMLQGTMS